MAGHVSYSYNIVILWCFVFLSVKHCGAVIDRGITPIGSGDKLMEAVLREDEFKRQAQELINNQPSFEFDSEEAMLATMRCTACKRLALYLNKRVVGRMETSEAEETVLSLAVSACKTEPQFNKNGAIKEACLSFVKKHGEQLVDEYVKRTDPDEEEYDEAVGGGYMCRSPISSVCQDVKSLEELLGGRVLDEQRDKAKEQDVVDQANIVASREKMKRAALKKAAQKLADRKAEEKTRKRRVKLDGEVAASATAATEARQKRKAQDVKPPAATSSSASAKPTTPGAGSSPTGAAHHRSGAGGSKSVPKSKRKSGPRQARRQKVEL